MTAMIVRGFWLKIRLLALPLAFILAKLCYYGAEAQCKPLGLGCAFSLNGALLHLFSISPNQPALISFAQAQIIAWHLFLFS